MIRASRVGVDARPVPAIMIVAGLSWRKRTFGELGHARENRGNSRLRHVVIEVIGDVMKAHRAQLVFVIAGNEIAVAASVDGASWNIIDTPEQAPAFDQDIALETRPYFADPVPIGVKDFLT